ncbi:MAG: hypothetical protein MUE58_10640 [Chitinophagaceae bacterium]|nr:hypothetical protein [Chitinophagaceae bacterium]
MRYTSILPGFFLLLSLATMAQKKKPAVSATDAFKKEAIASIDQRYAEYRDAAQQIWNFSGLNPVWPVSQLRLLPATAAAARS